MGYQAAHSIEFTILDETKTIAYQVITPTNDAAGTAAALARATAQFQQENPSAILVSVADIADADKRRTMDRTKTWWNNRAQYSHQVLL